MANSCDRIWRRVEALIEAGCGWIELSGMAGKKIRLRCDKESCPVRPCGTE